MSVGGERSAAHAAQTFMEHSGSARGGGGSGPRRLLRRVTLLRRLQDWQHTSASRANGEFDRWAAHCSHLLAGKEGPAVCL